MAEADIPVVVGRFDVLLRSGLADVLRTGRSIRVCASNVDAADLASVVAVHKPQVLIVDEARFDGTVDRLKVSRSRPRCLRSRITPHASWDYAYLLPVAPA